MRTLLWIVLAVTAWLWASDASAQVLPPCCQTPDVIQFLEGRPANEAEDKLAVVWEARVTNRTYEELEADRAALNGACTRGCPELYRKLATRIDRELDRRQDTLADRRRALDAMEKSSPVSPDLFVYFQRDLPQQDERRPSAGRDAKPLSPSLPAPRANLSIESKEFSSRLLLDLQGWTDPLDVVPPWLDIQLEGAPAKRLGLLQSSIGGACSQAPPCSKAMKIAGEHIVRRMQELDRLQQRADQRNDVRLAMDTTLQSAWIAAGSALFIGIVTIIFGVFQSRQADRRLLAVLAQIEQSLSLLATIGSEREAAHRRRHPRRKAHPRPRRSGPDRIN